MKTILTAVFASLVSASAFAANRCSVCLKAAPRGKTLCASCANKKARDERQARREAAKVAQEVAKKAASEANAAPAADGTLKSDRIESFCGYKFGETIPSVRGAKLTAKGNYDIVKKLDTPFRSCTKVCLTYTGKTHALYRIEVFSDPDPKLTEEVAAAEFTAIAKILQEKYKDKMSVFYAGMTLSGGTLSQGLGASCQKSKVNVKGKLKGSVGSVQEGWSYSICMFDRVVETDTLPTAPAQPDTTGSDVL